MKTNPNDAAFARPFSEDDTEIKMYKATYGLSKLEYFSVMAMQGLLAKGDIDLKDRFEATAIEAVNHAKALIDELNKEGDNE